MSKSQPGDLYSPKTIDSTGCSEWDRLPGESSAAFSAFGKYRDMGPDRTLVKVAGECGKHRTLIERWSRDWNWVARCWAFDAEEDERMRVAMARDRLAMRRRQADAGQAMQVIAAYGIRELQTKIASGQPLNLSVHEIVELIRVGAELERKARGEGTEGRFTKIVVNLGDAEPYPDEDERPQTPLLEGAPKKPN